MAHGRKSRGSSHPRQLLFVYIPHPYDEKRFKTVLESRKQKEYKDEFDFIEVHNGRNISNRFDEKQKKIQEELQIQPIIGSDAHTFIEIGRNYIIMEKPTKDTLKHCVKEGKLIFMTFSKDPFIDNNNVIFSCLIYFTCT